MAASASAVGPSRCSVGSSRMHERPFRQQQPRQGEPLPLPAEMPDPEGRRRPSRSPSGRRSHPVARAGPGRAPQPRARPMAVRIAEADVVGDRGVEDVRLLRQQPDVTAEVVAARPRSPRSRTAAPSPRTAGSPSGRRPGSTCRTRSGPRPPPGRPARCAGRCPAASRRRGRRPAPPGIGTPASGPRHRSSRSPEHPAGTRRHHDRWRHRIREPADLGEPRRRAAQALVGQSAETAGAARTSNSASGSSATTASHTGSSRPPSPPGSRRRGRRSTASALHDRADAAAEAERERLPGAQPGQLVVDGWRTAVAVRGRAP